MAWKEYTSIRFSYAYRCARRGCHWTVQFVGEPAPVHCGQPMQRMEMPEMKTIAPRECACGAAACFEVTMSDDQVAYVCHKRGCQQNPKNPQPREPGV